MALPIKEIFEPQIPTPNEITDIELATLEQLEIEIKEKTKIAHEYREQLKARGSFSTEHFVVVVREIHQERMAGIPDCIRIYGREELIKNKLINRSVYKKVEYSRKS